MYLEAQYSAAQGWRSAVLGPHLRRERRAVAEIYGLAGDYDRHEFAQVNVYYCAARMLIRLRDRARRHHLRRPAPAVAAGAPTPSRTGGSTSPG